MPAPAAVAFVVAPRFLLAFKPGARCVRVCSYRARWRGFAWVICPIVFFRRIKRVDVRRMMTHEHRLSVGLTPAIIAMFVLLMGIHG